LSIQEQEILYWLAIEREAVSLENVREDLVLPMSKGALLEALDSLRRRSLIETRGSAYFTLQPVIMEFVTNKLTQQAFEEFVTATVGVWKNYALIKAQAKDYVRDSQVRLILMPLAERLLITLGRDSIQQKLKSMLSIERQMRPQQRSYMAGNILNLLVHLQFDLRGTDFSHLMVWQAYLQNVALPEVNFAHAHFVASVFTHTFGNILSVVFNPDSKLLAAGTASGDIWIYQIYSGTPHLKCHGHTDGVWSVAFSVDGFRLASSSDDHSIRLWDMSTGYCIKTLHDHTNRVRSIAFSPDGKVIARGSDAQTIRLWDAGTGEHLKTLQGHTNRVWSLAFRPEGRILADGNTDDNICLYDIYTGYCLNMFHGHTN